MAAAASKARLATGRGHRLRNQEQQEQKRAASRTHSREISMFGDEEESGRGGGGKNELGPWRSFWFGYAAAVRLPGAQRESSAIFPTHTPTVNIQLLHSRSHLKDGYIYPSY